LTVSFVNTSNNGVSYSWNFGDGNHSAGNNPVHIYTATGYFDVMLEAVSAEGCKEILLIPDAVEVFERPVAAFDHSPDNATIIHPRIEFRNHSLGANSYWWDFGDGTGTSDNVNPVYMYEDTGTYVIMLVAITSNGCEDTTYGEVIIEGSFSIYIPNSFTPNNDGRNEVFTFYGEGIVSADLQIFNRWGDVIYKDASRSNPSWDGNSQDGNTCQQGVYVYLLNLKDEKGTDHQLTATVTLLK
jgi:gliding motility-associated-like protein